MPFCTKSTKLPAVIGAFVPSTSISIGAPLTVITTVALPSRRGKSFIPGTLSLASGDGLEDAVPLVHPPKVKAPIINRTTKNCENFNRIVSNCISPSIFMCYCQFWNLGF